MSQSWRLTCFIWMSTTLVTKSDRVIVGFNDGWEFHKGDDLAYTCSTPSSASDFDLDLTGVQITGLQSASASSAASCKAACAADCYCQVWNYNSNGQGCWVGKLQACGPSDWVTVPSDPNWTGGGRYRPAQPPDQLGANGGSPADPSAYNKTAASFSSIKIPHDYIISEDPVYSDDQWVSDHGYRPFSNAWYRKRFSLPSNLTAGTLVRLEFDGIYRSSDVFLDGYWLGHHESGYTQHGYWLHNATPGGLVPDQPVLLAVHVDASTFQEGWYYEGGGITRDVRLVVTTPVSTSAATSSTTGGAHNSEGHGSSAAAPMLVSIVPFGVYVSSIITSPVMLNPPSNNPYDGTQTANATVMPQVDISNSGSGTVNVTVTATIVAPDGTVVATATSSSNTLPAGNGARVQLSLPLSNAQLWFPAQNASSPLRPLYTLVTSISDRDSGKLLDSLNTTFGIRNAVFDPNQGLFINGFPVKITGFSMHGDFGGVGMAVPSNIIAFRVQRLLELGGNGWRTAHNPPFPALLAECDRRGVMVWEENRFLRAADNFVQDAYDMVLADRNHPSIIMWSLCNENGCLEDPGMEGAVTPYVAGAAVAQRYKDAMMQADGTRPITANTHAEINEPGTILDALDVLGVTYDYSAYDTLHALRPFSPVIGGESASCESDRGFSINGGNGTVSSYGPLGCTGPAWAAAADRDWISGNFAWAGADYGGESSWPAIISHYGVIDLCGFPKPTAHWYEAWWGGTRTAHMGQPTGDQTKLFAFPAWDGEGYATGDEISIVAFTTAPLVSLTVNGALVGGNQSMQPFGYAKWDNLVYKPGSYTVTSYTNTSADDGTWTVASVFTSSTPGTAAALNLTVAWGGSGPAGCILDDGVDTAIITVAAVDDTGALASASGANVTFEVTSGPGALIGVCNGNPVDHSNNKASYKALYAGLARIIIQSTGTSSTGRGGTVQAGDVITVTASANGLPVASISLPTCTA